VLTVSVVNDFSETVRGQPRLRVLMVCMGNICRSPTAEAVLRHKLVQTGLDSWIDVDSAGTHGSHVGSPPDSRSQTHAKRRGYQLDHLRARKVESADFHRFDLILAMDWDNLARLQKKCPGVEAQSKLRRLTEFIPARSPLVGTEVVGDPYYGGAEGFEAVLDLVEAACDGLVDHLHQRLRAMAAKP
jgi:protein-tyrosine phosphatase